MAEVEYLHVCDYAFPAQGGKACIIGIFKNISFAKFPGTHASMFVAVQFQGGAHEVVPFRIELGKSNGDVIVHADGTANMGPEGAGFLGLQLIGTTFPEQGRYTVKVLSAGRTLATDSIRLNLIPQSGAPPAGFPERRH
jgi:hypothetical protein